MADNINIIVKDIVRRCVEKNVECSPTLAAFMARAVVLEYEDQFHMDEELSEEDVEKLIGICVTKLTEKESPALETVKMQVAFDLEYKRVHDDFESKAMEKEASLRALVTEIVNTHIRSENDIEVLTLLYRRIFKLLLIDGDVDSNTRQVEREIAAALESVFPRIALKAFAVMTQEEKEGQLDELSNIVLGIRLFNQEIGKGGAELDYLPFLLKNEVDGARRLLDKEMEAISDAASEYVQLLSYIHQHKVKDAKVENLNAELANRRQYLSLLHFLQQEVEDTSEKIEATVKDYYEVMETIKSIVGSRQSVPKDLVYPKFDIVAGMWKQLRIERAYLQGRIAIMKSLRPYKHSFKSVVRPRDLEAAKAAQDGNLDEATTEDIVVSNTREDIQIIRQEDTPNFMELKVEFRGYCPWTLVERGGLLFRGNPSFGFVQWMNRTYAFASQEAMGAFINDPNKYVQGLFSQCRLMPELIYLLGLEDHFPAVSIHSLVTRGIEHAGEGLRFQSEPLPTVKEMGTETPLHFVQKHVDISYEWNEWELRRKAIQLTNLRHKKTHSSQTALSHFRRENYTQHYAPMHVGSQTVVDTGSNVPKKLRYFAGLRGHPDQEMQVVNVSLEHTGLGKPPKKETVSVGC
eukprot:Rmarinus@m.16694